MPLVLIKEEILRKVARVAVVYTIHMARLTAPLVAATGCVHFLFYYCFAWHIHTASEVITCPKKLGDLKVAFSM